ncbi:hypothetical protein GO986_20660 [Deinococcus sp. HMF7620]|uniref:JAB domain-containing protein n=1 Tax=Deinococcus arboris TaxID=2682977 RepID=A0A7C9I5P8_9DEIO|nr:hypothetical protein [Deinococcus arboris]MVN89151.1 hypothetical protein [Deinococcus arboris]
MRALKYHAMVQIPQKGTVLRPKNAVLSVSLQASVVNFLFEQLHSPARICGGLLFGYHEGTMLRVVLASSAGFPQWYEQSTRSLLTVDDRFTLGWAEAVAEIWGGQIDWCGNWTIHPTAQCPTDTWAREQFSDGQMQGLFDEHTILLIAGWRDGVANFQAYVADHEGNTATAAVSLSSGTPTDLPALCLS